MVAVYRGALEAKIRPVASRGFSRSNEFSRLTSWEHPMMIHAIEGTARLWTNSTPDGVELIVRWSVPRLYVVLFEFSFEWSVLLQ